MSNKPPMLKGCDVLPVVESGRPKAVTKPKPKQNRRRTADRFAVLNSFVDFTMLKLKRTDLAVWLVLYRDTKSDGIARTGQADIARRAGVTDRTVRRSLGRLRSRGLLDIVRRGRLGAGPSAYRVHAVSADKPNRTLSCPVATG